MKRFGFLSFSLFFAFFVSFFLYCLPICCAINPHRSALIFNKICLQLNRYFCRVPLSACIQCSFFPVCLCIRFVGVLFFLSAPTPNGHNLIHAYVGIRQFDLPIKCSNRMKWKQKDQLRFVSWQFSNLSRNNTVQWRRFFCFVLFLLFFVSLIFAIQFNTKSK